MQDIQIYTDGSCWPNDGSGNGTFGFIVTENNTLIKTFVDGRIKTTNNRMELCGVVTAIKYALANYPGQKVRIYSDSQYVVKGYNIWSIKWFKTNKLNVKNIDIWTYLNDLRSNDIELLWIKGHNGHQWNEFIDQLCNKEFEKRYGIRPSR